MGLTQKILLFTSALVISLVVISLAFTTVQADRLARQSIVESLNDTRQVWETAQADRFSKLKLGIRVLGNDPALKALVDTRDTDSIVDTLKERNLELTADFFMVTDPAGQVLARTDRPVAPGEDLSADPLVRKALNGEESATIWRQSDHLFHAVAVPMQTGNSLNGILIAGYGINEQLASGIRKLTHSEIAYLVYPKGGAPQLSVSTLGQREGDLQAAVTRPELATVGTGSAPFALDLGGDHYMAVTVPLKAATGDTVGAVVALRSVDQEMGSFRRFRNDLVLVSLVVMLAGLAVAYFAASRITGPVRTLVDLVERARSGTYTGKVEVQSRDEIGTLARTFNHLMTDLREKSQMIDFLREDMTMLRKGVGVTPNPGTTLGSQETAAVAAVTGTAGMHGGDLFADRYDVRSTLGKGGMGVVYRAYDRTLDEEVALKVLRPDVLQDDPTLLERFKTEIKLARRITHRNILRTHDFGETAGTPYISMEYLEGVTLKDLLVSKGALPLGVGLSIAKQMTLGLEAAHEQGVVHRDIKPQNMLIIPETGELKIMDFGIARGGAVKGAAAGQSASGLTTAGTVMGTPDYMAPEQAQGMPADFRSDIYSLGIVLFEVFSGKLPFPAETPMKVVLAQIQTPPPAPRSINPRVPAELEAVILRCMQKDPGTRYQTVSALLEALSTLSARVDATAA